MGPTFNDWCPYEERRGHRETHAGKKAMKMRQRLKLQAILAATSQGMPRNAGSHQKLERKGRILP